MNIAVIFAGGVGSRMHSKQKPKQFLEMYNKPIIIHTMCSILQEKVVANRLSMSLQWKCMAHLLKQITMSQKQNWDI